MFKFYLWLYNNLIHIFGFLGTVLAVISVLAVFFGSFILSICILSISLLNLYVDKIVKEKIN
jgi:hypothetical protein